MQANESSTTSKRLIEACATGLYLGKIRKAPGTFGTLLGLPIAFLLAQTPGFGYMIGAIVLIFGGAYVAQKYEVLIEAHDPGEIVIDEVAGYVIAMTWLPLTWQSFLAAFVFFRFFDILKPYPINRIDQKVSGGLGTMLDDVAAGLVSNVLLQVIYQNTSWLGVRMHAT